MTKFVVEGGVFTDTTFKQVEPGTEERYGPFENWNEACETWHEATFNTKLDTCCHRLLIKEIE